MTIKPDKKFASFVINYIRRLFDHNDEGDRVAYFELLGNLDDAEIDRMIRIYTTRARWAEYPDFIDQIDTAEEHDGSLSKAQGPVLSKNQRHVLLALGRLHKLGDSGRSEWERDANGRPWPKRAHRAHQRAVLVQGRYRTLCSLERLGLVRRDGAAWLLTDAGLEASQ